MRPLGLSRFWKTKMAASRGTTWWLLLFDRSFFPDASIAWTSRRPKTLIWLLAGLAGGPINGFT